MSLLPRIDILRNVAGMDAKKVGCKWTLKELRKQKNRISDRWT
jgi:hypothetical protein